MLHSQRIVRTVKAIKEIDPESVMVHVEATGLTRTVRKDLAALAEEEEYRGYLCFDLISGRLTHDHKLFSWLVRNGTDPAALDELVVNKIDLDVLGLNFYPQWSTSSFISMKRPACFREVDPEGDGFASSFVNIMTAIVYRNDYRNQRGGSARYGAVAGIVVSMIKTLRARAYR